MRDYGRFVSGVELSYDKLNNFDFFDQFGGLSGNFIRAKVLAGYDSGRFLPYAALSYARLTFSEGNPIFDFRETGLGFGLGAKFMASPRVLLGVEWMTNNLDIPAGGGTTDLDLNNFTVSASYRF
ncbi:outer membrane beta-barrel protein [Paracoccus alkenifer]|uniref:outer membrane beta-barrel protein n=1 Tax=Paracoccus alkenifer TaxID=65735 RepID=UPI000B895CAA